MKQIEDEDLVYKGPWVRSAQQRLFQTLEGDYGFPKATCRSLVNLMWDFLQETYGEKLHEGQIRDFPINNLPKYGVYSYIPLW
ncbi:MAG TPA: hypothetical protein C5S50_02045 [Methanosarcinaceae archaeon]|nr:hypothetical protein [Methanosarcinaceae archaeon]